MSLKEIFVLMFVMLFGSCSSDDKKQDDVWTGFVYPDKNNLYYDINIGSFDTLHACRSAAIYRLEEINAYYSGDYECGLNCELSARKPYICMDTNR